MEVSSAGQSSKVYTVDGGEVDLKVRDAKLEGTVAAEWNDANGDRFADEGDTVSYAYTVGNAGNVALTGLSAPDASISQDALAVGGTVTATRETSRNRRLRSTSARRTSTATARR